METLTEYYPAFEQVGLKKEGGKCCELICHERAYECKGCPIQEALDKLYWMEKEKNGES